MARVVITASADADVAAIISDLAAKAGVDVAGRYTVEFDALYQRSERFPQRVNISSAPPAALASMSNLSRIPLACGDRLLHDAPP